MLIFSWYGKITGRGQIIGLPTRIEQTVLSGDSSILSIIDTPFIQFSRKASFYLICTRMLIKDFWKELVKLCYLETFTLSRKKKVWRVQEDIWIHSYAALEKVSVPTPGQKQILLIGSTKPFSPKAEQKVSLPVCSILLSCTMDCHHSDRNPSGPHGHSAFSYKLSHLIAISLATGHCLRRESHFSWVWPFWVSRRKVPPVACPLVYRESWDI